MNNLSTNEGQQVVRFIKRAIIFAIGFIAVDFIIPYIVLLGLTQTDMRLYYEIRPADVLILGDSHTSYGIDADIFDQYGLKAENYSRNGHFAEFNYYFYQYYRLNQPRPKLVILSTAYFTFQESSETRLLFTLDGAFNLTQHFFDSSNLFSSRLYQYQSLFQEIPSILYRALTDDHRLVKYGYGTNINPFYQEQTLASLNYTPNFSLPTIDYLEDGFSKNNPFNYKQRLFFKRLLHTLAEDGVQTVLLETPEFIHTQQTITHRDIFHQEIEEEIANYDNIIFIRQQDMHTIDPTDLTLFFDGGYGYPNSHLSFNGSKIYTQELVEWLLETGILKK